VQDWREEVASDLEEAEKRLQGLKDTVHGEPNDSQLNSIWRAYVSLEKSVFFIKVELDAENPGAFVNVKAFRVPDERQAMVFALGNLQKGAMSFRLGDLHRSLGELRAARNYLRVLLREKRRLKARRRRLPPGT
jgi:hypothetical protein